MFERFTDEARRGVVLAQEEAVRLKHGYIGTEHILLALLRADEGVAATVLSSLGVTLERARAEVEELVDEGTGPVVGHIPFTPRAKRVLELSLREALQLGHSYIGTEHILLGLVRQGDGVAVDVLQNLGVDISAVKQSVMSALPWAAEATERPVESTPLLEDVRQATLATARSRNHSLVGTDHLLLALLRHPEGGALRVLREQGVDLDALRQRVEATLDRAGGTTDLD